MESSLPLHDRPAACVVAQQYSSATFVSLTFHSRKKKSRCVFLNVIIVTSFTFITNALRMTFGISESCHAWSVRTSFYHTYKLLTLYQNTKAYGGSALNFPTFLASIFDGGSKLAKRFERRAQG